MYPYHYFFTTKDKEREAYENNLFWFNDALHYPEPLYPFDIIWDEAWFLALSQFNTRIFMIPPVYGVDHRIINGNVYISPVPVTDPEEVQKEFHYSWKGLVTIMRTGTGCMNSGKKDARDYFRY